jgi:hypothetical protein
MFQCVGADEGTVGNSLCMYEALESIGNLRKGMGRKGGKGWGRVIVRLRGG